MAIDIQKSAQEGFAVILQTCKLLNVDYDSLDKNVQDALRDIYITGLQNGAKILVETFYKSKQEYEQR